MLDQQNDVTGSGIADSTGGGFVEAAQTFTVGVTGTLSRIAAQINWPGFGSPGQAILTVYSTTGGVPDTALGTASLSTAGIPSAGYDLQSFDVSSYAIPVHAGDVLAYGITSSINTYIYAHSTYDHSTYDGGESIWRQVNPAGPWTAYSSSHDNGFQTYVIASSADLPGDFNGDAQVDAADYVIWRKHVGESDETALHGNGDNMNGVDEGDYGLWRIEFRQSAGERNGAWRVECSGTDVADVVAHGCGFVLAAVAGGEAVLKSVGVWVRSRSATPSLRVAANDCAVERFYYV